ncbi:MAG: uracil-DNA glycosylase [Pleurocapsa sp. MO_226.B13]|nr:uracil-DNA glycosylase [Pleurocapsa sp. MO_226.B13]
MAQSRFKSSFLGDRSALAKFNPNLVCHSWQELETYTNNCQACGLHKSRSQVVAGRCNGNREADLLIIGEAPGRVEDEQGLAFVGDSGKLLDIMLDSVGLESWYITNVVRCRPLGNRNPTKAEYQSCWGFLQSEIALVKPLAILVLGKVAARTLLGTAAKFEKLMRTKHQYFEYPVWVAYHPAYLLRQPQLTEHSPKWEVWQVLCQVKLYLDGLRREDNERSLFN